MPGEPVDKTIMPLDEVRKFLTENVSGARSWYEWQTDVYEKKLNRSRFLGIFFGFLATILAAFPLVIIGAQENIQISESFRWLIVILSSSATLVTGTLQPYYYQIVRKREAGRVQLVALDQAETAFLSRIPLSEKERTDRLTGIINRVAQIENEYGHEVGAPSGVEFAPAARPPKRAVLPKAEANSRVAD